MTDPTMMTSLEAKQLADLALLPPVLNTNPGSRYGYDKLDYGMTVGIERTRGGRLWASWVGGGDNEKAYMVFATSDDAGASWSAPRLVIDPHDHSQPITMSSIGGVPWLDPHGRLWIFFALSMSYYDGRMGVWVTRCDDPDADDAVWTQPERVWHGFALNKPTVLSTGEWVLPVALWPREIINCSAIECVSANGGRSPFSECFHELDPYRLANVLVSRDEGKTWERRGGASFPIAVDFLEPMIVERRDGSLWMVARTFGAGMWQSVSHDGGATWTVGSPWLDHVNSRHFLRRLPSGRILLVKHGIPVETRPKARSHLTAYLSDDDGATWQGGLVLDERAGVSYPDGAISPDGGIFISYDYNRDEEGEVFLARFREEDVLAGRCVTPGAILRQLISRPNPAAVAERHAERKRALFRRLVNDTDIPFTAIPQWQAWDGIGTIEMSKLNMNNGGALPALDAPLLPESSPDSVLGWKVLSPAPAATDGVMEGFVTFDSIAASQEGKVGYARSWVYSPDERAAIVILGLDYWMQFRVNGALFLDHSREMRPSWAPSLCEFRCDVPLRAGWNFLEAKVASGGTGFAFACQIGSRGDLAFSVEPQIAASLPPVPR